jgi:MATE family multidrug resistance protein
MRKNTLPASRMDEHGQPRVDLRAILAMAFPLFIHAGLQAVLNLTDTWFVSRISSQAVAGVGGVYWLILGLLLLVTGMGMAVQTYAAQAYGARKYGRAARSAWNGLWLAALTIPVFALLVWLGDRLVPALALPDGVGQSALDYWGPRFSGGPIAVAQTAVLSFFMAIGQVRLALSVNIVIAVLNAIFNAWFIWGLDWGVSGVAWATTASLACGWLLAMSIFLNGSLRWRYRSRRFWRPQPRRIYAIAALGFPIGLSIAFDVLGLAAFQAMVTKLGAVQGAATQIVMMLTSVAYMPAVGLGKAGTTLVGQSIGAGRPDWARRVGNRVVALTTGYMFAVGVGLALFAEFWMGLFVSTTDPSAAAVVALGVTLAWIAGAYQVFDGVHLGAVFCLRGAGDTRIPAILLLSMSWGLFVPLSYFFAFERGQGWFDLPGLGWGAAGGWFAALLYIALLAGVLGWRWFSGRWMRHGRLV